MHNLTERDGMFTVRQPAWHWAQTQHAVLDDYPTREEAQRIAHNWEPISEPLYRQIPYIDPETSMPMVRYEEIEDFKLNVRSDDAFPLGVVTDTFGIVNNSTMYDIADEVEGLAPGEVKIETAGSLKGGKKVWLLLRLAEPICVTGDPHGETILYYALQNAHDGSGAFRGQAVNTRIVCDNTSVASDLEAQARGTEFVFHHTKNVSDRIEEAKVALRGWRQSIEDYKAITERLMNLKLDEAGQRQFIEEFIPMPKPGTASDLVERNVRSAQADLRAILKGETCEGIQYTAYGLVQGSVEYLQHARKSRSNESHFKRAYLDRNRLVSEATELALTIAR